MTVLVSAFLNNVNTKYTNTLQRYYDLGKLLLQTRCPKIVFLDEAMMALVEQDHDYDPAQTVLVLVDKQDVYLNKYIQYLT